jgi:dienelactone hydrolase
VLLVAACAEPRVPGAAETVASETATYRYAMPEHDVVSVTIQTLNLAGRDVRVELSQPSRPAAAPVVIYLPGLGEASDAGGRWRSAWAGAGYAVLSVQLMDEDVNAWSSDLARTGDFKALGRRHFADTLVLQRVRLLAELVQAGQARTAAGDPVWHRMDWGHLAIAGFDLGAYTAMVAAGEKLTRSESAPYLVPAQAIVALSPHVSRLTAAEDARYRNIHVPVLLVSSDADDDPLGLVENPALRRVPFERIEAVDVDWLALGRLPHAALGGQAATKAAEADSGKKARTSDRSAGAGSGDSGQHHKGGKHGGAGDAGDSSRNAPSARTRGDGGGLSANAIQLRANVIQDISTAFLDAHLKGRREAAQWLAAEASLRTGELGEFAAK